MLSPGRVGSALGSQLYSVLSALGLNQTIQVSSQVPGLTDVATAARSALVNFGVVTSTFVYIRSAQDAFSG